MPEGAENIRLGPSQTDRFISIVESETEHAWSIVVATVDPDGLGTAMILKEIILALGLKAEIYYGGAFSHPQNETIWNLFELEKHLHPLAELPDEGPVALADSCKLQDSRFHRTIRTERFRIIVDHHRDKPVGGDERFLYIASCGAAATLAWLLVEAINAREDSKKRVVISEDTATLAAIGIMSDTDCMTSPNVKQADLIARAALMRLGSQEKVSESFNYDLPPRFYEIQMQCLKASTVIGPYLITHPDSLISAQEGDFLGIIADDLRKREGIKTVVVWGMTESVMRGSIRTKSKELNLNTFITEIFGDGHGGGKHGSGGAIMPIPAQFLPTHDTVNHLIAFFDASFREKLEKRVGSKAKVEENGLD